MPVFGGRDGGDGGWGKRLVLGGRCRVDEERHVEGRAVVGAVTVEVIFPMDSFGGY